MVAAGATDASAYVVDLADGQPLYAHDANTPRLPASVEKLYTTTTALLRFGPSARLETTVLSAGSERDGTYTGTLYLRGGGDPTFGSAAFDHANYGTGATMQQLVANLLAAMPMKRLRGAIVADESLFDSRRGTPATNDQASVYVEGELSALAYNRGWADPDGTRYVPRPALEAGQQFLAALRAAGVKTRRVRVLTGTTPAAARPVASVSSPRIATLLALTNAPSDNFFAEMLLKGLGARFGAGGTTAAGAAVVSSELAHTFGIHPRLNDGSGLSYYDYTTPVQVVTLLSHMADVEPFTASLAVAGETGTLQDEMVGTDAQRRCIGKTGTLQVVSNLVGYCHA
jgi:D-alanyl-D-alanine carboxypeptidase/D-alanyl-D-alanine-endopeptidase (penicillin-binding protein 4)